MHSFIFLAQEMLVNELLRQGLLGVICLGLIYVIITQYRENKALVTRVIDTEVKRTADAQLYAVQLKEAESKRTEDSKTVSTKFVEITTECVTALTNVTHAIEKQRVTDIEFRNALEDIAQKTELLARARGKSHDSRE